VPAASRSSQCHLERLAVTRRRVPGPAALPRHDIPDGEVVSLGPLGVDQVRQSAVKDVGVQRAAGVHDLGHAQLARRHPPQLHRLPALAADAQPPAHHQPERPVPAGGEVRQRAGVGLEAEVGVAVLAIAVEPRHAGAAARDRRPVRAELLHVEHVGHRAADRRRRSRQRHQDQAPGELRVVLRHPVERGALTVGLFGH
jgi:hypothetical protein